MPWRRQTVKTCAAPYPIWHVTLRQGEFAADGL
jgi:hypothetical protein